MPFYDKMKRSVRVLDMLLIAVLFANHMTSTASSRPEKFNDLEGYVYNLLNGDRGLSHFLHFGLKVKL